MLDWNPALYSRFEDERTRPARDLLARVVLDAAAVQNVVDLGCGPGNSTELLVERFRQARVTGTDNSEAMLASARERLPQARFELSDIATWAPQTAPDLIYANAALQWVPAHETLLPRLLNALAPGGVLAIQMPDNRDEPTHRLMREVAAEAPWAEAIGDFSRFRTELLGLDGYYNLLAPLAAHLDVWRTAYQHPMDTPRAIVDWVRGTGLKPFVDRLPADLQASYLAEYERRVGIAYPARTDGRRLLAFPRLFIVAQRKP
ncbi:trans-aconitate 2-methyltransferase [Variovorax sp. J22G21]|uniref:trans-aconitate 2-methyltransferase n=1 Tax=Variovorax fucosicus TaxID=3053517 RepID=UPI0025786AB7|nr:MULTISPECIES: trans-aconitate 2-methyltransferase [unclassified Variovorax]MDM0040249.1 trans-aconitate 2-methyltransferase [Variovorax sp. J22R193]MDM0061622.1 trans-aconitate 2-methyltransferase [Variovorax sp. J22G21]